MECSKLRYALDTYGAKSYVCHQFLKFKQYSTLTESCIQLSIGSIYNQQHFIAFLLFLEKVVWITGRQLNAIKQFL